jgi:hypothetical protein
MYTKPANWEEVEGIITEIGFDFLLLETSETIVKLSCVRVPKALKDALGKKVRAQGFLSKEDNKPMLLARDILILK